MGVRYQSIASGDVVSASANTDFMADTTIEFDGLLHIAFETLAAEDVRISLDGGTNFTTLVDTAADIWNANIIIPVEKGDVIQMQTVGAETISFRLVLEHSTERD